MNWTFFPGKPGASNVEQVDLGELSQRGQEVNRI